VVGVSCSGGRRRPSDVSVRPPRARRRSTRPASTTRWPRRPSGAVRASTSPLCRRRVTATRRWRAWSAPSRSPTRRTQPCSASSSSCRSPPGTTRRSTTGACNWSTPIGPRAVRSWLIPEIPL